MRNIWRCTIILVFFLLFCNTSNTNRRHTIHPFQTRESYNGSADLLINEKILNAPPKIIGYLNELDGVNHYSSYEPDHDEKQLFMDYYELLPIKYRNIMEKEVIGVYFINNFLGGGMTLPVFDNNGKMNMVLYFNPEILHQNISEWINFRDNSVFLNNENKISLIVECNSNYFALIHTLVHEASHIYDYYNHVTPFTEKNLRNSETKFPTDFIEGIWVDYDEPVEKYNYEKRKDISFYGLGDKIDKGYAADIFTSLKNTPFNSLYGSKTWAEDFAESFTWYYLNKRYNINYTTRLMENGKTLLFYNPNENGLVKERDKIFEEILE